MPERKTASFGAVVDSFEKRRGLEQVVIAAAQAFIRAYDYADSNEGDARRALRMALDRMREART